MKKIILFIGCVFCLGYVNAQAPVFEWAKKIGSGSDDIGNSIAVDALNNVYTTGSFIGTVDFDPGAGIFNLASVSYQNVFISKLDAFGNFVWAKSIGGTSDDCGYSISIDSSGNIYTTGYFNGTVDFDPGASIYNLTSTGGSDIFILKLDSFGNFVWAKSIGNNNPSNFQGNSVVADASGNVYSTGYFYGSCDFDPNVGTFTLFSTGIVDMFILKIDTFGNFVWAKNMGTTGTAVAVGNAIEVDELENVYTTGRFANTVDFDPGSGNCNFTSSSSGNNMFVLKLDGLGNFVWAKNIGGVAGSNIEAYSIVLDASNNVYTTGQSVGSSVDFDPGVGVYNLPGGNSFFISKLDNSGNFVWVKRMGGNSSAGVSIALDKSGNVYATGHFAGTADFDPGTAIFNLTSVAGGDIFLSKLDSYGNFVWAKNMGGVYFDIGYSVVLDASDNVFTTGFFKGTVDFDPDAGIFNLTTGSYYDVFIQKLSQPPTSINEATNSNTISIYPNPNSGTFNISLSSQIKNGSIEVYNSIGALVYVQEITNQENSVELSNQANGLYFVKVMCENKIVGTGKIVKE